MVNSLKKNIPQSSFIARAYAVLGPKPYEMNEADTVNIHDLQAENTLSDIDTKTNEYQ